MGILAKIENSLKVAVSNHQIPSFMAAGFLGGYAATFFSATRRTNALACGAALTTGVAVDNFCSNFFGKYYIDNGNRKFDMSFYASKTIAVVAGLSMYGYVAALSTEKAVIANIAIIAAAWFVQRI